MLYQREFQNNEEPAKHHISCFGYETEADRQYPTHCHAYCENVLPGLWGALSDYQWAEIQGGAW